MPTGIILLCVTCMYYCDLLQRVSIPCFEVVSGNDRVIEYHDEMVQVRVSLHRYSIIYCYYPTGLHLTSCTRNVLPNVQGEYNNILSGNNFQYLPTDGLAYYTA